MTEEAGVEGLRRQQRVVFRCVVEFLLDLVGRQIRKHDGDFTRAVIYMAAIQASRWPARAEGNSDSDAARTFSVRAIAQSMSVPYETTRRKIAELEAAGLARRVGNQGYVVAPATFEGEAHRADSEATWRALRKLISDLQALDFDLDAFAGGSTLAGVRDLAQTDLVEAAAALANDCVLRVLESGVRPHGSMMDSAIVSTLILINAELLTHDPELAWQYSGAANPPPDNLRKPGTITEMSTMLGLTHETVRRRIRSYIERGWVKRVTGGYLYGIERMQEPEVLESGVMVSQRFLQLTQSLRQLGIAFATLDAA